MAGKGPQPTPTAVLKLRGSWRAKQRKGEPVPADGMPSPPTWLKAEARAEWKRIVPELHRMKVLGKIDRGQLANACFWWGVFVKEAKILNDTEDLASIDGRRQLASTVEASKRYQDFCDRCGLSPAARTRLRTEPKAPKADKEEHGINKFWKSG